MISAVIPVLNGADRLPACLAALVPGLVTGLLREALVVDGGSRDASAAIAAYMGCKVLQPGEVAGAGRGAQIRAGLAAARGPWLLLLHADTILAPAWVEAARRFTAAEQASVLPGAGWFDLVLDDPHPGARRVERLANWRARWLGLPYGDQGLLIHRATLEAVGGVRPLPLMEDLDLVRRLGPSRLTRLPATAITSAERYRRDGWWARPARNLLLASLFLAGVPATTLRRFYG